MKKIISYLVLVVSDGDISKKVNELIGDGWQPIGGISRTVNGVCVQYAQAMVKYEPDLSMEITARGDMSSLGGKKWKKVS